MVAAAGFEAGSSSDYGLRGLHLSGADEQGPRDAVVMTVDCTKILWLLRLDGEPYMGLWQGCLGSGQSGGTREAMSSFTAASWFCSASVTGSRVISRARAVLAICGVAPAPARGRPGRARDCSSQILAYSSRSPEMVAARTARSGREASAACGGSSTGCWSQVADPPPGAVERDAEDHERHVVQLAGRAGEQGLRPVRASPATGKPCEPAGEEIAGEVLLGDAGRAALAALAEVSEVGQRDIAQDGLHRPRPGALESWQPGYPPVKWVPRGAVSLPGAR